MGAQDSPVNNRTIERAAITTNILLLAAFMLRLLSSRVYSEA
jgi:hypothetical protein